MRSSRRAFAACVFATAMSAATLGAPLIDRVLAVVQGSILTLSDVNAAIALGLVNIAGASDPIASALEQLIERSLQLVEVERYAPPEPATAEVDARVGVIRRRFASEAALEHTLRATGLTLDSLRSIARDDLRLQAYMNQRFAFGDATDDEVLRYYREHQQEFLSEGVPQPLEQVAPAIRRRLETSRRAALIDEWSKQLRLRADVLIVPRN